MSRRYIILVSSLLLCCALPLRAQSVIGFEDGVPAEFSASTKKALSVTDRYYKEGGKSLEWEFQQ